MSNEKDNVLEILDDVERKVEEFRAAALRLAEDKVELERSVAFVESLTRGMPEMSEVSPIIMMSLGICRTLSYFDVKQFLVQILLDHISNRTCRSYCRSIRRR